MLTRGLVFGSEISTVYSPAIATTKDRSRYKSDCTNNDITYARHKNGQWYHVLNGGSSYYYRAGADSLQCNFSYHSFTISTWIYTPGGIAAAYIVGQGVTDVDGWGFFLFTNNISLRLNQAAAHTDISTVGTLAYDKWQLIGVTRNGNEGQFYVDGEAVATMGGGSLADAVSVAGGNDLVIGVNDNKTTQDFEGYLFSLRIFNRELSPAEILKIYNAEKWMFGL